MKLFRGGRDTAYSYGDVSPLYAMCMPSQLIPVPLQHDVLLPHHGDLPAEVVGGFFFTLSPNCS